LVKHRSLLTTLAVLLIATLLPAAIVHVPGDQPTIQAGINAARNGDTVMIDPGTYFENINFNGKAITVISSSGPVSTIIDGGSLAPVVTFASGETPRSVLSRLTLQHGASTFDSQYDGGGIFISNSSPTISKNIIQNNTACNGGAGIAVQFGSPRIQSNTITSNSQFGCTGGIGGGGISVGGAGTTEINGNLISNNHWTSGNGGGISLFAAGAVRIKSNIITGNSASGVSPAAQGGGISMVNDSPAIVVQNLIYGNTADQGAGIYFLVPSGSHGPLLVNNTIANNAVTQQQGSAIYANGFDNQVKLFNNLLIGQRNQSAVFCDGTYSNLPPAFSNNDALSPNGTGLQGTCAAQANQNGNISADPKFVSNASNFKLKTGSPAIDAGTNSAPNLPLQDLSGLSRIVDGNADGTATIDMGVFEAQ